MRIESHLRHWRCIEEVALSSGFLKEWYSLERR